MVSFTGRSHTPGSSAATGASVSTSARHWPGLSTLVKKAFASAAVGRRSAVPPLAAEVVAAGEANGVGGAAEVAVGAPVRPQPATAPATAATRHKRPKGRGRWERVIV